MNAFDSELNRRLNALREQGLYRELRRVDSPQSPQIEISGRTLLNFSSNDYLGLANHPTLKEAAIKAIERYGSGAGASRLVCGSLAPFHELEEALAAFKGTEATLAFSSGYAAAVGTITALLGKDDIIILDKLVHASIVDAAKLSGAKLRVFTHNDLNDLEDKLKWAQQTTSTRSVISNATPRTLIVTESIFSMDGDRAPLKEIVALKNLHGAWLMVDEAHATGLHGKAGRGIADELGVSNQIEIQMGTLGKALGASGGYICGSRALIETLVNRARSFVFSTAPVPAAAAAAHAGIQLVQSADGETRRQAVWDFVSCLQSKLPKLISQLRSAILPVIIGDETAALKTAAQLFEKGIYVPAIRYPTVARGSARLRVTVSAAHTAAEISKLAESLPLTLHASRLTPPHASPRPA